MTIPNTSTQPRSRWQVATMATIGFAIVWNFITHIPHFNFYDKIYQLKLS